MVVVLDVLELEDEFELERLLAPELDALHPPLDEEETPDEDEDPPPRLVETAVEPAPLVTSVDGNMTRVDPPEISTLGMRT
jgi:hypothetical protein